MAKHRVKVTLNAETEVFLEVDVSDAEPDGDPTDLTDEEREEAIAKAFQFADWEVESVQLA